MNTESKFKLSHDNDEFQVSYFDYFTKRYQEEITQKKQPMILARAKLPPRKARKRSGLGSEFEEMAHSEVDRDNFVYIVPELCYLVGLTEQMKSRTKTIYRDYK